jgi:hypothetical protein
MTLTEPTHWLLKNLTYGLPANQVKDDQHHHGSDKRYHKRSNTQLVFHGGKPSDDTAGQQPDYYICIDHR